MEASLVKASLVKECGGTVGKVSCRFVQASKAFGSLYDSAFTALELTLETKIYIGNVVSGG